MLTDVALKNLKLKTKPYKVTDRDGIYVVVTPTGSITFRLDYRLNNRRETLTLGRYGADDVTLFKARELGMEARRKVKEGISRAIEKQRDKARIKSAKAIVPCQPRSISRATLNASSIIAALIGLCSTRTSRKRSGIITESP